MKKKKVSSFIVSLFLLFSLPLSIILVQKAAKYLSRAAGEKANIVVDVKQTSGQLNKPWQALAQGGEETEPMLDDVIPQMKALSVRYIRLDHIYDYYETVSREGDGRLIFNWTKLDQTVDHILASGAKPFFALSYMPAAISQGDVTDAPRDWNEWQQTVKATIEHYSGRNGKNLTDIYYEVFNEPDLFGGWKVYGEKNYLNLYYHAAMGAQKAENVNFFKIGGPATTALYKNWIDSLIKYVEENNLRLDFLSWHRYHQSAEKYKEDLDNLDSWLTPYGNYANIEKVITEWGIDSENNAAYDNNISAGHALAVIRQFIGRLALGFSFEIKDGPSSDGREYWGRWGLITHEKFGLHLKPRYEALKFLNKIEKGELLSILGEGSWVTGFSVKEDEVVKLFLVNYDGENRHSENVPISFINLEPNNRYSLRKTFFLGKKEETIEETTTTVLEKSVFLGPNSAVLIELTKLSAIVKEAIGRTGKANDRAVLLDEKAPPLILTAPQFSLKAGSLEFWFQPNWFGSDAKERDFFKISLTGQKIFKASKVLRGFGNRIEFGIFKEAEPVKIVSASINDWRPGEWYHLNFVWNSGLKEKSFLRIFIDEKLIEEKMGEFDLGMGNVMTFQGIDGIIDELIIKDENEKALTVLFQ